jgi:hypothetical protein
MGDVHSSLCRISNDNKLLLREFMQEDINYRK